MLFADAVIPTPSGAAEIITAVGVVITAITGLIASVGVLYNIVQNAKQATESKQDKAKQTDELKTAVETVAAPIAANVEVVKKQTNGAMQEAIRVAVAEALAAERAKHK